MMLIGAYAPASFMQHFIVFALSCFVGFRDLNVTMLHTPLMAVTDAISASSSSEHCCSSIAKWSSGYSGFDICADRDN